MDINTSRNLHKLVPILATICLFPRNAQAGLDKFSYLEKIEDWTIERKVDSITKNISCRASILNHGTWFSARIRLDRNDKLVFPSGSIKKKKTSSSTLTILRRHLKACRTSLIYMPKEAKE